jgi:hypothetical protein
MIKTETPDKSKSPTKPIKYYMIPLAKTRMPSLVFLIDTKNYLCFITTHKKS